MRILFTILSPLILGATLGAPARAAEPEISLTLSAAQDGAKAGAEVRLNVLLTNLTDHRIEIESFPRSPDLGPHEKITDEVAISKIYDLSKPGKYTILASRIHQQSREAEFVIRSNMITVTISE